MHLLYDIHVNMSVSWCVSCNIWINLLSISVFLISQFDENCRKFRLSDGWELGIVWLLDNNGYGWKLGVVWLLDDKGYGWELGNGWLLDDKEYGWELGIVCLHFCVCSKPEFHELLLLSFQSSSPSKVKNWNLLLVH